MPLSKANLLLLLAAALWGFGNVAQAQLMNHMGPMMANGLKCLLAAAVMVPLITITRDRAEPFRLGSRPLLILSALTFTFATLLAQAAYGLTTVTAGGFLINTCTIFTPVMSLLLVSRKPNVLIWPAAALAVTGLSTLSNGSFAALGLGEIMALGSALFYAIWMVTLGEFIANQGCPKLVTCVQFIAAGLCCTIAALVFENNFAPKILAAVPLLLFLGLFSTCGAYLLQAIAQKQTSASDTAIICSAEAIFGAIAAYFLLGETLALSGYIGVILITAGIVIVQWPLNREENQRVTFAAE